MTILENSFDEKHLLKGEMLLEKGHILEISEIDRKLWSIMIKDNGIIEVEVQNPYLKSQKVNCECKTFAEEKACGHIVAALLHLRKLEAEKEAKKQQKSREKQTQAFNIKTVLSAIDTDQLKNYVRSYAQKDKAFGVMLKASFAGQIDLEDNLYKYQSILSTLIKPMSTDKLKSNTSDLRLALKVINEFNSQVEDNISLSQYAEAYDIIAATLPKLHYLYSKYNSRTEAVVGWIVKYQHNLSLLYQERLAPKFMAKMDDFVVDLFEKSFYNHLEEAINLFQIIDQNKRKTAKSKMLERLTSKGISSVNQNSKAVYGSLLIINKLYDGVTVNDDIKLKSIAYLMKSGYTSEAISFLELYLKNQYQNKKMEFALISAYRQLDMTEKYHSLAIDLYLKNNDIRIYRNLKADASSSEWKVINKKILSTMGQINSSTITRATYYYNEEMTDALIEVLEAELDIRHIMKYDFYLYKNNFVDLQRIYHAAISQYLDTHVGSIATSFIDEVMYHLQSIKAYKMESSIKSYITENYPHRSSFITFK